MGKTVAVTGVASGIGAELARILKGKGHRVIGFDIVPTQKNVDQFIELDLSREESIKNAVSQVNEPIDGMCNNAGLPPRDGLAAKVLQVNFIGLRSFTNAMASKLNPDASIVNLASRAGHGWRDNLEQAKRLAAVTSTEDAAAFVINENMDATRAYNLSKEAVILWTMASTERLINAKLRMNSLSPGGIATGILDDFKRAFGDKVAKNMDRTGRAGHPEEVAEIAAFLLSSESHWIKGADISIDGGMSGFNTADALELGVFDTA